MQWQQYRETHNLRDNVKIFLCGDEFQGLIKELEARGWHRNTDAKDSIVFDMKFLSAGAEKDKRLDKSQIVNYFQKSMVNVITTTVDL